jgi:hypothetical protein
LRAYPVSADWWKCVSYSATRSIGGLNQTSYADGILGRPDSPDQSYSFRVYSIIEQRGGYVCFCGGSYISDAMVEISMPDNCGVNDKQCAESCLISCEHAKVMDLLPILCDLEEVVDLYPKEENSVCPAGSTVPCGALESTESDMTGSYERICDNISL